MGPAALGSIDTMDGVGIMVAGALLFALLLAAAAAFLWQESRRGAFQTAPVYALEEAVPFVHRRLGESLTKDRVRRILEWGVHYLQGHPGAVAGGEEAVQFVVARVPETEEVVRRVFEAEAHYWAAIGAVGEPVEEMERS